MHLHIYKRGPLLRYGVAIIAVAIALVARYLLIPYIGVGTGYITLLPAILIVAKLAGRNPAIVTGLIGGPAAAILFTPTLALHTVIELAIVIGTAVLTGWLVQGFHNARDAQTQILESIPGMVFTTRPDGYCDYQSLQWVNYTGVPSEQMLGDGWNKLLHPEDQPRALAAWRAAIEGRAPYDLDYRIRRHDGKYEWFKVRGHPIRNAEGRIAKWFGVAINIDAFKRAQENLLHAKELLESRNTDLMQAQETLEKQKQGLEAIIHVVSHDLRAPLLNVRGFSDILKDECTHVQRLLASEHISDNTSKQLDQIFAKSLPEAFGIIETSARAMHNLIDSLVKIARAGLVVPVPETVDMTALLREIVDSISIKFKETGVTIDLPTAPTSHRSLPTSSIMRSSTATRPVPAVYASTAPSPVTTSSTGSATTASASALSTNKRSSTSCTASMARAEPAKASASPW